MMLPLTKRKSVPKTRKSKSVASCAGFQRKFIPRLEHLEDRTLLSSNIPLSTNLQVTYNSTQYFNQGFVVVSFNVDDQNVVGAIGLIPITLSNGNGKNPQPEFESLCVAALNSLPNGTTSFQVQPTSANTTLNNGGEIAYLYNHYGYALYNNSGSSPSTFAYTKSFPLAEGVGLQLAVWELEYGLKDSAFSFVSGYESYGSTKANFTSALTYCDSFVSEANGKNENADFLDTSLGGTVTNPYQSVLAPTAAITSLAGASVVVGSGAKLTDSATLTGGFSPTGRSHSPCTIPAIPFLDTEVVNSVNGDGTYTTPTGYVPTAAGTYQWVASYGGDTFNLKAKTTLGNDPETVNPAKPTLTASPSASSVTLGASSVTLDDNAVLSGGYNPTGSITFTLYQGNTLVDTETATVSGNGSYSTPTGYTLPTTGGRDRHVSMGRQLQRRQQ